MFGLPVAGALIPAPPGPSALTANTSRVDLRVAVQEAVGALAVLSIGLGVLALGRLSVGLWLVRRLRRSAMLVADADLPAMVDSLASRMRIRRRIELRESLEVDTAMTGGWLRPFVLLPPGMAATLGSEIEPVLAHELAHVRRRDFAVAVLQAIADAGTRLSPGQRWLSLEASRIREQACDDVVVTLGVEPLRYARALAALGQWSRGVQVTNVVCAANRHLAARVRRLLEGPRKPRALATLAAVVALCAGALAATLVAAVAPGLPSPPTGDAGPLVGPTLISTAYGRQATDPFRIMGVDLDNHAEYVSVTVQSVYPKAIVALTVGAEVFSKPSLAPEPPVTMHSDRQDVQIEPGHSAVLKIRLADGTLRQAGRQVTVYPSFARFEDGTEWRGDPPPQFRPMLTIPSALVSPSAPAPASPDLSIPTCYDAEGTQQSEGAIAAVRESPAQWVWCTNGRWVPTRSPAPPGRVSRMPIQ